MRIAIFLNNFATAEHHALANKATQAAQRAMPGCSVETIGGERPAKVATSGEHRPRAQAELDGEVLFLDADCEIRGDLSHVWEQDFDIALPEIDDPFVRYTGGVVFSRSPAFWLGWADAMARFKYRQEPDSRDQLMRFGRYIDGWPGRVLRLPWPVYERLPKRLGDPCDGALIVHYRGRRKAWWTHG